MITFSYPFTVRQYGPVPARLGRKAGPARARASAQKRVRGLTTGGGVGEGVPRAPLEGASLSKLHPSACGNATPSFATSAGPRYLGGRVPELQAQGSRRGTAPRVGPGRGDGRRVQAVAERVGCGSEAAVARTRLALACHPSGSDSAAGSPRPGARGSRPPQRAATPGSRQGSRLLGSELEGRCRIRRSQPRQRAWTAVPSSRRYPSRSECTAVQGECTGVHFGFVAGL